MYQSIHLSLCRRVCVWMRHAYAHAHIGQLAALSSGKRLSSAGRNRFKTVHFVNPIRCCWETMQANVHANQLSSCLVSVQKLVCQEFLV
jgi:hypothetical protein